MTELLWQATDGAGGRVQDVTRGGEVRPPKWRMSFFRRLIEGLIKQGIPWTCLFFGLPSDLPSIELLGVEVDQGVCEHVSMKQKVEVEISSGPEFRSPPAVQKPRIMGNSYVPETCMPIHVCLKVWDMCFCFPFDFLLLSFWFSCGLPLKHCRPSGCP